MRVTDEADFREENLGAGSLVQAVGFDEMTVVLLFQILLGVLFSSKIV